MNRSSRQLWEAPWGYSESFLFSVGLMGIGFVLEFLTGTSPGQMVFPVNAIAGGVFIVAVLLLHFLFGQTTWLKWLSGIPASVSAIVTLTFLVLLMGITPQVASQEEGWMAMLGLNRMTSTWPFLLISLYLLLILGLVTVRRLFFFRLKNWGFVCSHLGLWIAIWAGGLGAGDLVRLKMNLTENKTEWRAYDDKGKLYELPLAIHLKDFRIEEFHPKLAVVENSTGELYEKTQPSMIMIEEGMECELHDWNVEIVNFLESSGRFGNRYHQLNDFGAVPSARIRVKDQQGMELEGWISCGSFNMQHESLKLDDQHSLVMTVPEPKRFSSEVVVFTPSGKKAEVILEVNKPFTMDGWKIYQLSYDEKMGKYSQFSIVELVRDPWQPLVYLGIFMMIIGAIHIFWIGKRKGELSL
ncbi:MAG: cytochrome c biogenesis protein ResB [Marinifilaceae bacterium]